MADNDFFKIVYIILYELYETKKEGKLVKKENIDYKRFKIPYSYYADIISELFENGYVRGVKIVNTKSGRILNIDDMYITMKDIEYLQDNSKMKQVYSALKEVKDWIPGM